MKLSTQPYKGARDFYPDKQAERDYMFNTMRECVRRFGYEEYDAPLIEPIEIYQAKSGSEIVSEQTYSFTDRGGREVAIRPEMTPTVSRMVAAQRQQLAYPLRWFSIPNLWRYERPQRGRFREHWQLNVDLFGVASINAELELMLIADSIFKAFKADHTMYAYRINHRQLLDEMFETLLGLSKEQALSMAHLIDRRAKMDHSLFLDKVDEILTSKQREGAVVETLLTLLDIKTIDQLPPQLKDSSAARELSDLLKACKKSGILNVTFDISLVRGFDYYSGIVFELYDNNPENNRSMLGGGRYDGLVGLFGVEPLPTVGFGLGDATMTNFLEQHHLMPEFKSAVDIYIAPLNETVETATEVANQLRIKGLNVAVDYSGRKLGDQIKAAQKKTIQFVLIIGAREAEAKLYTLKNLESSAEEQCTIEQLVAKFSPKQR